MGFYFSVKNILFRADASKSLGTGDLLSLFYFSEYMCLRGWKTFFVTKSNLVSRNLTKKHNIKNLTFLNPQTSLSKEISLIKDLIEQHQISVIMLELFELPIEWYAKLSPHTHIAIVNHYERHQWDKIKFADVVIDWDIRAPQNYPTKNENSVFLGIEYTFIKKDFLTPKSMNTPNKQTKKVLIGLGGSDEFNITIQIVQALKEHYLPNYKFHFLVGAGYYYLDELVSLLEKSILEYQLDQNIDNMVEVYQGADIVVTAGGLMSIEVASLKIPMLLIATYPHQIERCKFLHKHNCAVYLGFREFDNKNFLNALSSSSFCEANLSFSVDKIIDKIETLSS